MKTFKVLFLCVLLFLLACCTSAPPSSSEIQPSSFPSPSNGVSSAEPIASSEPSAESRDVSQMSAEEYYSVCREYVPFDGHSIYPERLQANQDHLWLDIFQSALYCRMMDQNTSIGPSLSDYPELSQDISPRENYLYWVVWDTPHYWMANPVTCEYFHLKTLYPIIPEPMTCFMLQNDLIWYGSENCELKSAGVDGSHIQAAYTFDTPIKQFCDFDNATPEERGVMYDGKICRGSYVNWSTGKTVSGLEMPYKFAFLQHGSGDNPQNYWYDAFRPGSGCTEADLIQWLVDYKE